jgi:hypothetical protein
MITTQADHTKWKKLGAAAPFAYFKLPDNYKEAFPKYTFHYECVEYDLDESNFTYLEIDGIPVILEKYLNVFDFWSALVDYTIQTPELNQKLLDALIKEFSITEVTWQRQGEEFTT